VGRHLHFKDGIRLSEMLMSLPSPGRPRRGWKADRRERLACPGKVACEQIAGGEGVQLSSFPLLAEPLLFL
jgi:hypothetical protein